MAGRPGRARASEGFFRATSTGTGIAGSDPHPHRDHPRTHPRGAAARKTARRHRHQTFLSGLRHHRSVRASDARGVDRRAARPGGARRAVPRADAAKDRCADRGADRTIQHPPRIHDATVSGPHRRPQRRYRAPGCPDRGGDGTFSPGTATSTTTPGPTTTARPQPPIPSRRRRRYSIRQERL